MMQLTLFDWRKVAPKRPNILSEEIAHATARKCRDMIARYLCENQLSANELDDAVKDIGKALYQAGQSDDAYKVCRCLESYSWGDGDDELHDIISEIINVRQHVLHDAIVEWVQMNGVIPCNEIGDRVEFRKHGIFSKCDVVQGKIEEIDSTSAKYMISGPKMTADNRYIVTGRYIVNFEDVLPYIET